MDFPRLSTEQRSLLEQATAKYQSALEASPAISYLEGRGITKEVAGGFRLGYVAEPETGHEHVAGRLAIPYLTPAGVVDISFRDIEGVSDAKYLGTGSSKTHLYNARDLHKPSPFISVCEGQLDAVVMSGLCEVPSCGIAGVDNWAKYFKYCFVDYEKVFIVMDPDDAGRKAAKKLRADLPNGIIITLPHDVNDTYLAHGPDFIRKALGL